MRAAAGAVELLPVSAAGTASRTVRDRLEILTALTHAPTFDPAFHADIIRLPRDHAVFGWGCRVPECQRSAQPHGTLCLSHQSQWREARRKGTSYPAFVRSAEPLQLHCQLDRKSCLICPDLPALTQRGLCYVHAKRWKWHVEGRRKHGKEPDFERWLATGEPIPSFGPCQAPACPHPAQDPLRLCRPHLAGYRREGRPGGAEPERGWTQTRQRPVVVSYRDEGVFRRWVKGLSPVRRLDGQISLLGLRPLVKAEIQWAMFQHTQVPMEGAVWPISNIQQLADHCRRQAVSSLADLDFVGLPHRPALVARLSMKYLQVVYFTREETKEAGFLQTQHFGISWGPGAGCLDLTNVTQRWLRDLLWDFIAHRLITDPPRSRMTIDGFRRGCSELSAFLEAQAPAGGHNPTALTGQHMLDFVADQRHRSQHGLPPLGLLPKGSRYTRPRTSSKGAMGRIFNTTRRVLRAAMDNGQTERIGLARDFIITLPTSSRAHRRRRPFPDDVARAVADEANLKVFESFDSDDRGLRDIWEGLVITGRRCSEVLTVRLECIGRLGGLPMFWHDQTKVGNYDEAIRISERLYTRIQQRQAKTTARFFELNGRQPTEQERLQIALFPRRTANRELVKAVSYTWFNRAFHDWLETLDIAHCVPTRPGIPWRPTC
ncbi:site-specific integrase [Streptomyces triculaminicus]|uniref:site-specific integrase n=1 Tax=Streptomyces triculaminicus TaxID=2816232 RepID=UPI0033E159EA